MFLSNDIIQNSKRKGNEFTQEFHELITMTSDANLIVIVDDESLQYMFQ